MAMFRQLSYSTLVVLLGSDLAWAAAPTRSRTYQTGQTIEAGDVTSNEDGIFSYLQAGVDTYAAGSVNAAAIADDAVGASEIAAGAVGTSEIATDGVEAAEIAAGAVGASEIASGAVDAGDMATTGTIADDKAFVADSSTAGTWRTIPNCLTSTSALQYTQSTNSFNCGTISAAIITGRVQRTAGNVTTTSTTLVDLTGASITVTSVGANPSLVCFAGNTSNNDAGGRSDMVIDVDGTDYGGTEGFSFEAAVANELLNASFCIQTAALTAASHTYKVQWKVNIVTGTIYGASTPEYIFSVQELND